MNKSISILITTLILAASCTPARITRLQNPPATNRAEVIIYRQKSLNLALVGMVFGVNGNDYAKLGNGESTRIYLYPGEYEFYVRSTQADRPYKIPMKLEKNEKRCVEAHPSPSNPIKSLVAPVYWMTHAFKLEEIRCPVNTDFIN